MDALRRWWPTRRRSTHDTSDRRQLGQKAEARALAHLERAGLVYVDRNVRAGRGEIDLVLRDGDTLVFVEVRARTDGALVSAAESLSARKCAKVRETAQRLIASRPDWQALFCRFDVVAVTVAAKGTAEIQWLPDAF